MAIHFRFVTGKRNKKDSAADTEGTGGTAVVSTVPASVNTATHRGSTVASKSPPSATTSTDAATDAAPSSRPHLKHASHSLPVPRLPPGSPTSYRYNIDYITKGASALPAVEAPKKASRRPSTADSGLSGRKRTRSALSAPPPAILGTTDARAPLHSLSNARSFSGSVRRSAYDSESCAPPLPRDGRSFTTSSASSIRSSTSDFSLFPSTSASTSATSLRALSLAGSCDPLPDSLSSSALYQAIYNTSRPGKTQQEHISALEREEAARQRALRSHVVAGMLLARSTSAVRPLTRRAAGDVPVRPGPLVLGMDLDGEGRAEAGSVRAWGVRGKGYVKSGLSMAVVVE